MFLSCIEVDIADDDMAALFCKLACEMSPDTMCGPCYYNRFPSQI